jgi:hypothetical protein
LSKEKNVFAERCNFCEWENEAKSLKSMHLFIECKTIRRLFK